jgi:uncharacterized Zn-binding protein involved in type VI secretion
VGGPIGARHAPTVSIGGLPAARVGDIAACVGATDRIVSGSATVLIEGLPAARVGDTTSHGGIVVGGCASVVLGG